MAGNFNLQFRPVVDFESEIFIACERGDIRYIQSLFDKKIASPNDVNQYGHTLLLVRIPNTALYPTDS
jgi:hypothetical protein